MKRIAIATCVKLPEPDHDEAPLLAALKERGVHAETLAWDDPEAEPGRFDAVVIRSTWNYIHDLPAFLRWAERTARATKLFNPLEIVRWNTHKGYLREVAVPSVPTVYADRGKAAPDWSWTDVVIKPVVGAGSFATKRFQDKRAARAFLAGQDRDMMIQPYLRSVEGHGERALIWIAGEVTHSVRKSPRFTGSDESVSEALPVSAEERAFAEKALAPFARRLLYARVDVAPADDGSLLLMELELVEPSLFLKQSPAALERLSGAIAAFDRLAS